MGDMGESIAKGLGDLFLKSLIVGGITLFIYIILLVIFVNKYPNYKLKKTLIGIFLGVVCIPLFTLAVTSIWFQIEIKVDGNSERMQIKNYLKEKYGLRDKDYVFLRDIDTGHLIGELKDIFGKEFRVVYHSNEYCDNYQLNQILKDIEKEIADELPCVKFVEANDIGGYMYGIHEKYNGNIEEFLHKYEKQLKGISGSKGYIDIYAYANNNNKKEVLKAILKKKEILSRKLNSDLNIYVYNEKMLNEKNNSLIKIKDKCFYEIYSNRESINAENCVKYY